MPNAAASRIPSAKSCRKCDNYQRGRGTKLCLKCCNYKLLDNVYSLRQTANIIPMVQSIIEAVPAPPAIPDNILQSMVWAMPASDSAIISMHYYGALSPREIATVLHITEPAARAKLYRAVQQLQKNVLKRYPTVTTKTQAKMQLLL